MNPFAQRYRLPMIVLLFPAVMMLNCGSDDEREPCNIPSVVVGLPTCADSNYQPGAFVFTASAVDDGCSGGMLAEEILGETLNVTAPPLGTLPTEVTVTVPVLGDVTVTLTKNGNEIGFRGRIATTIENPIPPPQTLYVEVTVVGSICPEAGGSARAVAAMVLETMGPQAFEPCCIVTITFTGQHQQI